MARNKVVYGGETLVDLTGDSVSEASLVRGYTAHNAAGERITGTADYAEVVHTHTPSEVGLGNVPNVATNDQTPTYTAASSLTALTSGEKLSVAFGKLAKAVSDLISHIGNKSNPHGVTKAQLSLGNVENKSSETIRGELTKANVTTALGYTPPTTSAASTSAAGLMSAADKSKVNYTNVAFGTCSTAAATAAKVITVSGNTNWALTAGSIITVKFSETNTAENPTFNVNGTGAKSVWYGTAVITTGSLSYAGYASRPAIYVYDGTQYVFVGWSYDANTTYTNVKLGQGYGTCSTAAATTAKVASLSSYTLVAGGIVSIRFTYDVPAGATLNINSKGAKAIYHKNAAITAGVIKAGDTATFIYSTYYRLIAIDRDEDTTCTLSDLGVTATATELNYVDGVTSSIQTQLNGKAASSHTHDYLPLAGGTITGNVLIQNSASAQSGQPNMKWKTVGSNTPYVGFATDQTDGTFLLASLRGTTYQTGLAIGGGSGNLLWKGNRVLDNADLTTVNSSISAKAPTASPTLTGTPKAPTATAGTNTTQIATTAFVTTAINNAIGTAIGGSY